MKSSRLVFNPIAAKAVTIRNLLVCLIAEATAAGMAMALLRIAKARNPQINQGTIFTTFTFLPSVCCSSFRLTRMPIQANTSTVGMMAMVRVSLTMVATSPAASEKA